MARTLPKSEPNIMEQQQNDSAEMDAETEKLSRKMALSNIIMEEILNYNTERGVLTKHMVKVNDVFGIIKRYLLTGYYYWTKRQLIIETVRSFLPSHSAMKDPQEIMAYPWSRKKGSQETLNPGAASHTSRKITLQSSNGGMFEVDEAVALESLRIQYYIDCNCADSSIPLEVTSKILSKVIDYCQKHVESRQSDDFATGAVDDNLKAWDAEFVKVDQATLFDLIHAAHYLDIKSLSELTCKTFVDMTRGKTQEDFKRMFELLLNTV